MTNMKVRIYYLLFSCLFPSVVLGLSETLRVTRSSEPICGRLQVATGLKVEGSKIERGEFPWMVALLSKLTNPPAFFCAGTLISSRHVVTAAHCILEKNTQTQTLAGDVIALLGAHNLDDHNEIDRISLTPEKIKIHDDWKPSLPNFDADIAILTFNKDAISFSNYVQPICLWNGDIQPPVNEVFLAGWGNNKKSGDKSEVVPAKLKIPIHTNEHCFLMAKALVDIASNRTFCAGSDDGAAFCPADSGGGLTFQVKTTFFFRGIVTSSLVDDENKCDVNKMAIFTDLLKFKGWVDQILKTDD